MRSCDSCGAEITALTGNVIIRSDNWRGRIKPDVSVEFCSWACLLTWIKAHRSEILAARAILKKDS